MQPPDAIEIRHARDVETRACRLLLPEMFTAEQSPELFVAIRHDPDRRQLAGAAAMGVVHGPGRAGFPLLVHVVPAHRRAGIGRALIENAVCAAHGRTPVLRAMQPVPAESQAAAFQAACGFDHFDEIITYETDAPKFLADMRAIRTKLERRGMIPAGARIVRLRDAPADQVSALMVAHFPAPPALVLARLLPGAPDGFDVDHSVALLAGDRLAGVLIFVWQGRVPMIEVRIVDRGYRGGWANVMLLEAATANGCDAGAERFRFFADTSITDTIRLAARAGAEQIRVERRFWRRIR